MKMAPATLAGAGLITAGCSATIGDSSGNGTTPDPNGNGPNGTMVPGTPLAVDGPVLANLSKQFVSSGHRATSCC
jgi:hypothetical protein